METILLTYAVGIVLAGAVWFALSFINNYLYNREIKREKERAELQKARVIAKIRDATINFIETIPYECPNIVTENLTRIFPFNFRCRRSGKSDEIVTFEAFSGFDRFVKREFVFEKGYDELLLFRYTMCLALKAYESFQNGDKSQWSERKGRTNLRLPSDCEIWYNENGSESGVNYAYVDRHGYYLDKNLRLRQENGELPLVPLDEVIFED